MEKSSSAPSRKNLHPPPGSSPQAPVAGAIVTPSSRTTSIRQGATHMGSKLERSSGSSLLGAELRRLRGARTLHEIAELTRSPALAGRILPLTAAGIGQLEANQATPTVEALHALSIVYKASP